MCILQPDHCTHHWIQISSRLPQQGQSHMDVIWNVFLPGTHQLEQGPWQHQNCGRKGHIQKASENSNIFSRMPNISTLFHYHLLLLFIITSCVHFCSVLFPCDCLAFWVLCYYSLCWSYQHVLCIVHVCHSLLLTNLSTMYSAQSCLRLGAISSVLYYYYYYYYYYYIAKTFTGIHRQFTFQIA